MLAIGGAVASAGIAIATGGTTLAVSAVISGSTLLMQGGCALNISDSCEAKEGFGYAMDTVNVITDMVIVMEISAMVVSQD
jgi:hypothetical protein